MGLHRREEPMLETHPSVCRFCHANCAILVDIEDGRPVRVVGDKQNPMYHGFSCVKGRQLPEQHAHPERLLHSQKRMPDGSYRAIPSQQAFDEIAEKLRAIVAKHGPRAVASYNGTYSGMHAATYPMLMALMEGIGSPMRFTSNTIDQPGKAVSLALHGTWGAPPNPFETADVCLLVGVNPLVAMSGGIPNANPGWHLQRAQERGMKLLVIDPRKSDVAKRADLHLAPKPGEDAALLAGLLHVITREGLHDKAFIDENVAGFAELYAALVPFTPEIVAKRCDVPVSALIELARSFARARRGTCATGTGPSMSGTHCTLIEYLALALNTVCGRWMRAGEAVPNPGVLMPQISVKAQANPPWKGYGYGEKIRVRGLSDAACGMPTAALADEILLPGEGQVRALLSVGGNPMAAWPDQKKTHRALEALELLVQVDIKMSATAKLADYVIAPKLSLEMPGSTLVNESLYYYSIGFGYPQAYAQYAPALVSPPAGSDVVEDWELFYELGRRLGHQFVLKPGVGGVADLSGGGGMRIDMQHKPASEDLVAKLMEGSRIPLSEVRKHPRGALFPGEPVTVQPRDPGWTGRLEVGNAELLQELGEVARETAVVARTADGRPCDYRMICRRLTAVLNSSGRDLPRVARGRAYNPAFMHPDDLAQLGVGDGDVVELTSPYGSILGIVEPDPTLRRGLVSMPHSFGDLPGRERELRSIGSNTSQLTSVDVDYDRFTGMPRMSDVPVHVERYRGEIA
jgi:anaerobic selenocysteine-containing dehydrogenase